jgi:hypothetical protein
MTFSETPYTGVTIGMVDGRVASELEAIADLLSGGGGRRRERPNGEIVHETPDSTARAVIVGVKLLRLRRFVEGAMGREAARVARQSNGASEYLTPAWLLLALDRAADVISGRNEHDADHVARAVRVGTIVESLLLALTRPVASTEGREGAPPPSGPPPP